MKRNRLLDFVVVLIAFAASGAAASRGNAKPVSFPSTQTEAISPNGSFAVINVDSDAEPYHSALFLENRHTKTRRKLLDYGRHVEVLWNPNSTLFAVTDYAGSNVAECVVFSTQNSSPPQNVGDALQSTLRNSKEIASLRDSMHIYWAAVRWTSPHALIVRVFGHTDVNPSHEFEYFHTYTYSENGR